MQVILKDVSEIINYDKNARLHSTEQIDQIANSINEFGFNDPIEIGPDSVIISGPGRLEAAIRLGLTKVPVVIHEHLDGSKREAYVLAANKIAMNSSWDLGILKDRLETLSEDEQLLTGFSEEELLEILSEKDFQPGSLDDQGKLDELEAKWVECPHCEKEFDVRDQL